MNQQSPQPPMHAVRTTCPYCGVGCGVLATHRGSGDIEITGDPDHPANKGRLCSKGTNLGATLSLEDRLLQPFVNGNQVTWEKALSDIADGFTSIIDEHGPDAVSMYVSGQLLTEDYYAANKFMKGCIGSANIDTNSRLCMASTVAGHKRAFGSDTVPNCYEDIDKAELIILVGSNLAWCHPILFQRIEAERQNRPSLQVICIDPRRTVTAEFADQHLALNPGTDVALFNGLITYLKSNDAFHLDYIARHVDNFEDCVDAAGEFSLNETATITGLTKDTLTHFYRRFAETEKVVTAFSQGVNQSTVGTDKVNAILNCHLLTGRIGKPGSGPLSLTGQPNAMGGREVGGLANQLTCHMELENPAHHRIVSEFWGSKQIPKSAGLKAIDLFQAIDQGAVKAIWIIATNPVDSMPDADFVKSALQKCPLVVVSDVTPNTDTAEWADILLPSTAWGEKSGTVTNSERCISRQRAFLGAPGNAKPDWWQIAEVARRMGFDQWFDYGHPGEIFDEFAKLSAFNNDGDRDFNIGGLAGLSIANYDSLAPTQWPCLPRNEDAPRDRKRFFADGHFFHPNKRARAVATPYKMPASSLTQSYPLSLNTGRIRDQWHTMTRTAKTDRLLRHIAEPFIEINPADAKRQNIRDAEIVKVTSKNGAVLMRARLTNTVGGGHVFAPMHWSDQYAANARIDTLVASNTDQFSGQPESKITPVNVEPVRPHSYGFVLTNTVPDIAALRRRTGNQTFYWSMFKVENGFCIECAGNHLNELCQTKLTELFGNSELSDTTICEFIDPDSNRVTRAYFDDQKLTGFIAIAPEPIALSRSFITSKLGKKFSESRDKFNLLYGRPSPDLPDKGKIICSCFNVGETEIKNAVLTDNKNTVNAIGKHLQAGTNCGSCRSEITKIVTCCTEKLLVE